jgi:hypothetical protein
MKVKAAMHKGVDWVSPDTPVPELARMRDRDVGAIPQDDFDPRSATARDVMTECQSPGGKTLPGRLTHTSRCLFANLAAMPGSLAILAAMRRASSRVSSWPPIAVPLILREGIVIITLNKLPQIRDLLFSHLIACPGYHAVQRPRIGNFIH